MNLVNRKNPLCLVFAFGMEARPFLHRVEVRRRWRKGKATYMEAFFEGQSLLVVRSGIGPDRAAAAIRNLGVSPAAIIAVGSAGALAPTLKVRDFIVSAETVSGDDPNRVVLCSRPLVDAITEACRKEGFGCTVGRLVTVRAPVWRREDRERLHGIADALAVDMESHAMGLEAHKLGIPFTAFRVISDDLDSPPLPDPKSLRRSWRTPGRIPSMMLETLRWGLFLRDFRRSVRLFPPVLTRFIRDRGNEQPQLEREIVLLTRK